MDAVPYFSQYIFQKYMLTMKKEAQKKPNNNKTEGPINLVGPALMMSREEAVEIKSYYFRSVPVLCPP